MGNIETEAHTRRRRRDIQQLLLASIAFSSVMLVAAITPNAFAILSRLPAVKRAQLKYRCKTAIGRLAAQGLVTFEKRDGKQYARITESGRRKFSFEEQKMKLKNKRRWDNRWRVIIFDIPEKRRLVRDRLRQIMSGLGFVRLQDSVWVFPYDCEDFVALLKADLKIGVAVLYLIVEQIENDKHLRVHFDLK